MSVVAATTMEVKRVRAMASLVRIPSRMLLQTVPAQLVVKSLETDAEYLGRLRLVVAIGRQRLQDQTLLGLVEARADGEGDGVRALGVAASTGPRRRRRREVPRRDQPALAHDGRPLDGVPQLPDIAGPGLPQQGSPRRLIHGADVLVVLRAELLSEGLDEERDVLPPLSQRRHGEDR